jgi:hypothetical protein
MGSCRSFLRVASTGLAGTVVATVLLCILALPGADPQKRPTADTGADLQRQTAELAQFAAAEIRRRAPGWTAGQIDQVARTIDEAIRSRRNEPLTPRQMEAFRESFRTRIGEELEYDISDQGARRWCIYLRWYVGSFAERQPLAEDEEALLDRQMAHLAAVVRNHSAKYAAPVIDRAASDELVAGVERGVAQWRSQALFPGLKRPLSEQALANCEQNLSKLIVALLGEPPPESGELAPDRGGVASYRERLPLVQERCIHIIAASGLPAMPDDLSAELPKITPEDIEKARRQMIEEHNQWREQHRADALKTASQDELEAREKMLFLIREMFLLRDASRGQYSVAP